MGVVYLQSVFPKELFNQSNINIKFNQQIKPNKIIFQIQTL